MTKIFISIGITLFLTGCFGADFSLFSSIEKETLASDVTKQLENKTLTTTQKTEIPVVIKRVPLPEEVRGMYWTVTTAGSTKRADQLISYMEKYGLNTVVIDLKADDGSLGFVPNTDSIKKYKAKNTIIKDLDGLLSKLADKNIYRIARIAIMRDNMFATKNPAVSLHTKNGKIWYDKIGSLWLDPAAPEVIEYARLLAEEAYARGFDEIQFDYVRFPSDGSISSIVYPVYNSATQTKIGVMQNFFKTLGGGLQAKKIPVSFDVFGMTFWSTNDYGIGQRLIDVYPYTDFVSPMPYPSHYPNGFEGYKNPALYPYEIIKKTLDKGVEMIQKEIGAPPEEIKKKIRPWLQDFDLGAVYTAERIEAEIKASRDAGSSGWILWNARNVYEPANYTKK